MYLTMRARFAVSSMSYGVWSTTSRPAKYQAVTHFIEMLNANNLINAVQDNENCLISAELHQCVKVGRDIQTSRKILK